MLRINDKTKKIWRAVSDLVSGRTKREASTASITFSILRMGIHVGNKLLKSIIRREVSDRVGGRAGQ